MNKIKVISFPVAKLPEQPQNIIDETEYMDFELMYAENQDYITSGKCYKCGKKLDYSDYAEQVWRIEQQAGYRSELDGSRVHIEFCDSCLVNFLNK